MKNILKSGKVPIGILSYSGSASCTASKIFQQGLKKEYLTFSATKSFGTRPICGAST